MQSKEIILKKKEKKLAGMKQTITPSVFHTAILLPSTHAITVPPKTDLLLQNAIFWSITYKEGLFWERAVTEVD